jgi:hypothetical protein
MVERITYEEASKNILQSIADGRYWRVSEDYKQLGSYSFDPPALQQKKAALILAELKTGIAKLPDPESCSKEHCGDGSYVDVSAQIMLLRIKAKSKFDESITRTAMTPEIEPTKQEPEPTPEPEVDESELTGAQKLQRARESVKGLIPSLNF